MTTGDGVTADNPISVVSAVVSDVTRPGRVLLGVRRPSAINERFPGVLSTPTFRLPDDVFALLTAGLPEIREPGSVPLDGTMFEIGYGGHCATAEGFVLETLMMRKLGLADALIDGTVHGTARARYLSRDEVADPLGTGRSEWTAMLTYDLQIDRGGAALPPETAAYSRFLWAETAKLPQAVANRDVLYLDPTLDPVEVCAHGLCLRVAVLMTGARHDRRRG